MGEAFSSKITSIIFYHPEKKVAFIPA